MDAYWTYLKTRHLKLRVDAVNFTQRTVDVLYEFHHKIEEIDAAKRGTK